MSRNFTTTGKMPKELAKIMHCRLLHSRVPRMTGKKVWNQEWKEWMPEIIYVCKEGCYQQEKTDKNDKSFDASTDSCEGTENFKNDENTQESLQDILQGTYHNPDDTIYTT